MKVLEALAARPFQHFVARLNCSHIGRKRCGSRSQTCVGETTQIGRMMILITLMLAPRECLFAEPRGRNPYVLRAFWGDSEFRDGSEIRGIREKIAKGGW
jgi:hypothetical protein